MSVEYKQIVFLQDIMLNVWPIRDYISNTHCKYYVTIQKFHKNKYVPKIFLQFLHHHQCYLHCYHLTNYLY